MPAERVPEQSIDQKLESRVSVYILFREWEE